MSVPNVTTYTSCAPIPGDALKMRNLKLPDVGAELSSVSRTLLILKEKLSEIKVRLLTEPMLELVSMSTFVVPLGSTCKWRIPELTEVYAEAAPYPTPLATFFASTSRSRLLSSGVAFTRRILALPDDPQPMVKEANAIKLRPAQNSPHLRRRITVHSCRQNVLLNADWMRTTRAGVADAL